jgi:hypothetical protein
MAEAEQRITTTIDIRPVLGGKRDALLAHARQPSGQPGQQLSTVDCVAQARRAKGGGAVVTAGKTAFRMPWPSWLPSCGATPRGSA